MNNFALDVDSAIKAIKEKDGELHAFIYTRLDEAAAESRRLGENSHGSPLHGVPCALKDEWDVAGVPTTAGSYRHRDRIPVADHPVHEVFKSSGAILLGKSNLSDMGIAPESANYIVGSTRNPHDLSRTAGGSSGGAAAAVAAGMAGFDWGTDMGGSIRLPAAFCGVLGMRLSNQTWPIRNLFPALPPGLEFLCGQGPLTKTIAQMRDVLSVAGTRLRECPPKPFGVKRALVYSPDKMGKWPTFAADVLPVLEKVIDGEVKAASSLPSMRLVRRVYGAVWASHWEEVLKSDPTITFWQGFWAVLSSLIFRGRLGDRRFHPVAAQMVGLMAVGRYTLYRDREKALQKACEIQNAFNTAWDRGEIVIAPVCIYPAPRVGRMKAMKIMTATIPGNLTDATCLSIPFGKFDDGLPRAIQLMGPPGSEETLLSIGERFILARDER